MSAGDKNIAASRTCAAPRSISMHVAARAVVVRDDQQQASSASPDLGQGLAFALHVAPCIIVQLISRPVSQTPHALCHIHLHHYNITPGLLHCIYTNTALLSVFFTSSN
jgi:hypothetical protein